MRANSPAVSMLDLVLGLPGQLAQAAVTASRLKPRRALERGDAGRIDNVVVAGMGGSGISGDLLRGLILEESTIPVLSCRDYRIPASVTRRSLFLAVSLSGNTEETLAAFRQALRRGCECVAVTSGGRLKTMAARAGIPLLQVPGGMPPRAALGYLFASALGVLEAYRVCRDHRSDLSEAIQLMTGNRAKWQRRARVLAAKLKDRLPVVYSLARLLDAVAERWRCQLNENAKVMCHTSFLPEHNHNEIVGMGKPGFLAKRTVVVALQDRSADPRTLLRLRHVRDVARGGYSGFLVIVSEGRSALARLFSLVMLGDLVSVELARLRRVDPIPVARIEELKRRMARSR